MSETEIAYKEAQENYCRILYQWKAAIAKAKNAAVAKKGQQATSQLKYSDLQEFGYDQESWVSKHTAAMQKLRGATQAMQREGKKTSSLSNERTNEIAAEVVKAYGVSLEEMTSTPVSSNSNAIIGSSSGSSSSSSSDSSSSSSTGSGDENVDNKPGGQPISGGQSMGGSGGSSSDASGKPNSTGNTSSSEGRTIGGGTAVSSLKGAGTVSMDLDKRPVSTPLATTFEKYKKGNSIVLGSAVLKRYYSVTDAEIYFGNSFVEDVNAIDWGIQQNVQPLFGYNSYIYDEVARGARIINGVFSINFTSPNYLFKLLDVAKEESITSITNYTVEQPSIKAGEAKGQVNKTLQGIIEGNNSSPIWPQTFDIDVIFGQKTGVGDPVHVILEGVVIQNCRTSLATTSSAVQEIYSFIARDVKTIA